MQALYLCDLERFCYQSAMILISFVVDDFETRLQNQARTNTQRIPGSSLILCSSDSAMHPRFFGVVMGVGRGPDLKCFWVLSPTILESFVATL